MTLKIKDILAKKAGKVEKMTALAGGEVMTAEQAAEFDALHLEVKGLDEQVDRIKKAQALSAVTATPSVEHPASDRVAPSVETNKYVTEKSLVLGGVVKMIAAGGGNAYAARQAAVDLYGESHPVTKALAVGSASAGGFAVAPDFVNEIIELLRPASRVREAGPRAVPMPRGTLTLPGQASAATAYYGTENRAITASQPSLRQIVATYKKLTALVPVSNDMMRYAMPAFDAMVRDDLVKIMALRFDLNALVGDGTQDTIRGFLSFANGWVAANGGTVGRFSKTGASVLAVNGTDPTDSTGGNFITSTYSYTLATAAAELGGAKNRLDTAQVPDDKRAWFMHPRSYNYLYNVQNSLGVYVFRDELNTGKLMRYPVYVTTQIGANWYDASGHSDCSFVFLAAMDEFMVLDSMQLELAISREGSYVDSTGATVSAFQNDQTLIRAIAEHDFQARHDQSVAVIQGVKWSPAIS